MNQNNNKRLFFSLEMIFLFFIYTIWIKGTPCIWLMISNNPIISIIFLEFERTKVYSWVLFFHSTGTLLPKKKEDFSGQKNKLGLNFLGQKIGEKIGNNVQKLTNFKEKKNFSGQKKTSWDWAWAKSWGENWV